MASQAKEWSNWLIEAFKRELETFDDSTISLLPIQKKAFELCCDLLRESAESLAKRSSSSRSVRQRARNFLKDIFRNLGPEAFLLCTLAASITNLSKKAPYIRLSIVSSWWENAQRPQGLLVVTKELCKANSISELIPSSRSNQAPDSSVDVQQEITNISEPSLNDSTISTTQQLLVLENASSKGTAAVFNPYMCDAIRKVTVDNDLKSAITMVFPGWGGLVDCVMSLYVYEGFAEQLAMALFNTEMKWVDCDLHVVLESGVTLHAETRESLLKGVKHEVINKVFGPEICSALLECRLRMREVAEGKPVTDCVSMIYRREGAIINLSLGLERGYQIYSKLYT